MAKTVRLLNISQIISTTGEVVNMDKTALGPPVADGHSASADSTMFFGGKNSYSAVGDYCEMKKMTSSAQTVQHGAMYINRHAFGSGSDGTQVMICGGKNSGGHSQVSCEMKQFLSTATSVLHGNLYVWNRYMTAGSDGNEVMLCNGFNHAVDPPTGYAQYSNHCEKKQFSSTATAVLHGTMTYRSTVAAGASDSTQLMVTGGMAMDSINYSYLKQFSSSTDAVSNGTLNQRLYAHATGSDMTQALITGGYDSAYQAVFHCGAKQFSSTATSVAYPNIASGSHRYHGAASDGDQVMFGGGTGTNSSGNSEAMRDMVFLRSFSASATAVQVPALVTEYRTEIDARSGTSS